MTFYSVGMGSPANVMMTISTFESARSSEMCVGTIFAKIVKGTRRVDGDQLRVEDFSGTIDIWVPRSLHHAGTGVNKWFAFDLVAEPDIGQPHPVVVSAQWTCDDH